MPGGVIDRRGVRLALNTAMTEGFRPPIDPDELQPAADATPLSRTVVTRPQRWHRGLTLPSGWLLLVCLFLPSLRFCASGDAFPMVVFPFVWPPYLVGMFVALAAGARPEAVGSYGAALFLVIRVSAIALAGSMVFEMIEHQIWREALIAIAISIAAFAVTWRRPTEVAVAGVSVLAAGGSFVFTLAIAFARLAVWGATVAAIAAGALVVGTLWWFGEALWARRVARCTQGGGTS